MRLVSELSRELVLDRSITGTGGSNLALETWKMCGLISLILGPAEFSRYVPFKELFRMHGLLNETETYTLKSINEK
jgi:hypothetical protein